jgi:exodeoxyribonuclease VII large subunit
VLTDPARPLRDWQRRVDDLATRLSRAVRRRSAEVRERVSRAARALRPEVLRSSLRPTERLLGELRHRLEQSARAEPKRRRHAIEALASRLDSLSPLAVLGRGYAICTLESGQTVRRAGEVGVGTPVRVRLAEGGLGCRVEEVRAPEPGPAATGGAHGGA